LLRYYDLSHYKEHRFTCEEEILKEAKKNRQEAERLDYEQVYKLQAGCKKTSDKDRVIKPKDPKLIGGIYFNPPPLSVINKEHEGSTSVNVMSNFFATGIKNDKKSPIKKEEIKGVVEKDDDEESD
jgi:hypothetical protein